MQMHLSVSAARDGWRELYPTTFYVFPYIPTFFALTFRYKGI